MNELERDVRLLRRDLAKGFVSPETVAAMLKDLPDVEGQGEWIEVEPEHDSSAWQGDEGDDA
jgi:hypothetical protein